MKEILHSQPNIIHADIAAVGKVLHGGMLSNGPVIAELEWQLANYLKHGFSLYTGNGSQAQALLLLAMGVGNGDEVIVPDYVCDKVLKAVQMTGATPVLCDASDNWLMHSANVASKITAKTKAIVLVHIYGINSYSDDYLQFGVPIIEDICQSFGHLDDQKRTGTQTGFAFTSFHGTKCLTAGEGGMLFLDDEEMMLRIKQIRTRNPLFTRGTDLGAAVVLQQFVRLEETLHKRNEIAAFYNENLPTKLTESYRTITINAMHFRYVLRTDKNFEEIKSAFLVKGIHVRKGVDILIHRTLGLLDNDFPTATELYNSTISIPALVQMSEEELNRVADAVHDLHAKNIL